MLYVKDIKTRDALINHEDGDICYCEAENKYFIWHDGWEETTIQPADVGEIKINYRDLVVNSISNFEPFEMEAIKKYQVLLNSWDEFQHHEFYMLYARELDYFTLLHRVPADGSRCLGKEVLDLLNDLGNLIYVEDFTEEDDRIIFWIKTDTGLVTEAYLFDYTRGVVPFA